MQVLTPSKYAGILPLVLQTLADLGTQALIKSRSDLTF